MFWAATQLQLPMTGANNSTTFVDVSSFNRTVSPFGNAKISTSLGFPAAYFDGAGDYLTAPLIPPGVNDFTIEMYIQPETLPASRRALATFSLGQPNYSGTLYQVNNQVFIWLGDANRCVISGLQLNAIQHIAWTRTNRVNRVFLDGVPAAATYTDSANYDVTYTGNTMRIAHNGAAGPSEFYQGYILGYRYTAASRYVAAFTPPPLPFEVF
jgi:hypothetical protein